MCIQKQMTFQHKQINIANNEGLHTLFIERAYQQITHRVEHGQIGHYLASLGSESRNYV